MKKILIILGSIALAILIGLGAFYGVMLYQASGLNSSGKAYVEKNVPKIVKKWSKQQLIKRSTPKLVKIMKAQPTQWKEVWNMFSTLGSMESLGKVKGHAQVFYDTQHGRVATAAYVVPAKFQNGNAVIKINLIQLHNHWEISGLHITSPVFLKWQNHHHG